MLQSRPGSVPWQVTHLLKPQILLLKNKGFGPTELSRLSYFQGNSTAVWPQAAVTTVRSHSLNADSSRHKMLPISFLPVLQVTLGSVQNSKGCFHITSIPQPELGSSK